jgi:hypothetical protein
VGQRSHPVAVCPLKHFAGKKEKALKPKSRGKLPGKTEFSGRRRSVTRTSGFHAHPDVSGNEFRFQAVEAFVLGAGESVEVSFEIPSKPGEFVGYGGWYLAPASVQVSLSGLGIPYAKTLSPPAAPVWSKLGSMWRSDEIPRTVIARFRASEESEVAIWMPECGVIEHTLLTDARKEILGNMHTFSPEAHFFCEKGKVKVRWPDRNDLLPTTVQIPLKACNRCARFLPINLYDEQKHLSFSNHCTAANRRPCKHAGFGRLVDEVTGKTIQLDYGFQLECRFCKKFQVNASHNPQRNVAQMKEDAARRRGFELLLTELFGGSAQLNYRYRTGRELADDIWEKFKHACFRCGKRAPSFRDLCLDHTRPLALLWPLDETATALCDSCNSEKRDRHPVDFYDDEKLRQLSIITGISYGDLVDPTPNIAALRLLRSRLDWFFDDFLLKPEMLAERDGKITGELLVKALEKVIAACPAEERFPIAREYEKRRARG